MDARFIRLAICALAVFSMGASHRTPNFVITAATPELAREIGATAEKCRREMAMYWLGHELPDWSRPCPVTAQVDESLGAGGVTSFVFDRGEVYSWEMSVQGTRERVLDSVLPHEVTHTIFASHFRQQLPRWADEGACTTVEDDSERAKHRALLIDFLRTGRGIAFNEMFQMREYPHDILPLYSQGHALAGFLIGKCGPRTFIRFVEDGLRDENWTSAVRKHYGCENLSELQTEWLAWVKEGCPKEHTYLAKATAVEDAAPVTTASLSENAVARQSRPTPNLIYRAQNARPTGRKAAPARSTANLDWRPPSQSRGVKPLSSRGDNASAKSASKSTPARQGEVILEWRASETVTR